MRVELEELALPAGQRIENADAADEADIEDRDAGVFGRHVATVNPGSAGDLAHLTSAFRVPSAEYRDERRLPMVARRIARCNALTVAGGAGTMRRTHGVPARHAAEPDRATIALGGRTMDTTPSPLDSQREQAGLAWQVGIW